ncbi:hypothetical protein E4K10_12345 [Streptomyces sp. T1317-0309]|nr:hypothetical protein E4K10_12345 [Streptomyces sp. T1317-0309]
MGRALWGDKKIGDEEKTLADQLVTDLKDWQRGWARRDHADLHGQRRKELLDEVATARSRGRRTATRTPPRRLQGQRRGAQKAYELLKPVASRTTAALTTELDKQFAALNNAARQVRTDPAQYDFVSYDKVTKDQRKELSDNVNALAEPLSKLAAAVVK